MRWVLLVLALLVVGCAFRLPTPAQQAQLNELRVRETAVLEKIDVLALKLKDGEITLAEFTAAASELYAEAQQLTAEIKAVVDAGAPLWSVIANGILAIALLFFGGKRNLPLLIGGVLETLGKKTKGK